MFREESKPWPSQKFERTILEGMRFPHTFVMIRVALVREKPSLNSHKTKIWLTPYRDHVEVMEIKQGTGSLFAIAQILKPKFGLM